MLTKKDRTRRFAKVCCNAIRNIAFYEEGWTDDKKPKIRSNFWIGANGAFLDIAVLEWCKIFTDKKGTTHWNDIFPDKAAFRCELRIKLNKTQGDLTRYAKKILRYRNKFVAHLDQDKIMYIPEVRDMLASISFAYDRLKSDSSLSKFIVDAPSSAKTQYDLMRQSAKEVYDRN